MVGNSLTQTRCHQSISLCILLTLMNPSGAIALCLLVVLGITSLPSVTATLSWREFIFVQSKLGWVAMVVAALHDIFLAWNYMVVYWSCFKTFPIGPQVCSMYCTAEYVV